MKRFLTLLVIASLVTGVGSSTSYAIPSESAHTLTECKKGNLELIAFLQTIIGFHGFTEGLIQPFIDLFRNECHAYDIVSLDNQQDTIKREIQNAFLMCDREKIPDMERAYYEIDAELYYVRHIVNTTLYSGVKETLGKVTMGVVDLERYDLQFTPKEKMYANMHSIYVEKSSKFSEEDFNEFFETLESKYKERMKTYVNCEKSGWKKVKEKLDEFIDNLGGLKEGFNELREEIGEGAEAIVISSKLSPSESKGFVENMFAVSLNGVSLAEGINEIKDAILKNDFWSGGLSTVEQSAVLNAVGSAREEYESNIDEAKLRAKYVSLYKSNTDEYLKEFLRAVDEMQFYLFKGISYLNETRACVQHMADKQCP